MRSRRNWIKQAVAPAALLLAGLTGCTSVQVVPSRGPRPKNVVVFPFEDAGARLPVRDHVFLGRTGCDEPGVLVADLLRVILKREAGLNMVPRQRIRSALAKRGVKPMPPARSAQGLEIAKGLGADAMVVGRVTDFRQSWFLLFSWSRVRWEARLVNVATGKEWCRVTARSLKPYALEEDLVRRQAQKMAKSLAKAG